MIFAKRSPANKGSVFETLNLLIIFVVMSFIVLAFVVMWSETGDALDEVAAELNNDAFSSALNETYKKASAPYAPIADWGMILLLFGVMISVIIVSFLLNNNAIFAWIYIIISSILVFVSIFIANGAYAAMTEPAMLIYSDQIPKTVWVIGHLLEITIVWVVLTGVALFTKSPGQDQTTQSIGL